MSTLTVTPLAYGGSAVFDPDPISPSTGADPVPLVDVANARANALGLYFASGTVPSSPVKIIVCSNSRNSRHTVSGGARTWGSSLSNGYSRWLFPALSGVSFESAYLNGRRCFGFDQPGSVWSSGSPSQVGAAGNTSVANLERFSAGSHSNGNEGPGGGVLLQGAGEAFASYVRSMTAANLPSAMISLLGSGGTLSDGVPMDTDSLLVSGSAARMRIYHLLVAGMGTWAWQGVESSSISASSPTITGEANASVNSSAPPVLTHTWLAGDSYTSGTRTIAFDSPAPDLSGAEVGGTFLVKRGDDFVGLAVIESVGEDSLVLSWTLSQAPQADDTVVIGPAPEIGVETVQLPAASAEYRGVRITNTSGPTFILGFGCSVNGAGGFHIGTHGQGGAGYEPQLDSWPNDAYVGKLFAKFGINLAILHVAHQSSDPSDMTTRMPSAILAGSPNTKIFLAVDAVNGAVDDELAYETAVLAQTTYAGASARRSPNTDGGWLDRARCGMLDNDSHPNLFGHVATAKVVLNAMGSVSRPPTPVSGEAPVRVGRRRSRRRRDRRYL